MDMTTLKIIDNICNGRENVRGGWDILCGNRYLENMQISRSYSIQ